MSDKLTGFVGHIIVDLAANGIEVLLSSKGRIFDDEDDPSDTGRFGMFDDEEKSIDVACGKENWELVLAHEYCHFTQWKDGLFDDLTVIAAYAMLDPWITGKRDYQQEVITKGIRAMQWIESDNENRTIALLDKWKVPYDREKYIRKSNVYVLYYEILLRLRRDSRTSLSDIEELLALVPGDRLLTEEEFDKLPDGFETFAIKAFFEPTEK